MQKLLQIDNAKVVLIGLVVIGHLLEPLIDQGGAIKWAYLSIYTVHMPAFVMLAGYLTKIEPPATYRAKLKERVLVPLVVFAVIYEIFHYTLEGCFSSYVLFLQPYWLLWFLYCLLIWRFVLPYLLRIPLVFPISVICAVAAGGVGQIGYDLGLGRLIYFLPFFLFGHLYLHRLLAVINAYPATKALCGSILVAIGAACWWWLDQPHQWLYGSYAYTHLGVSFVDGSLVRTGLLSASLLAAVALVAVCPTQPTVITTYAPSTLWVYLWHGFVVKLLIYFGWIGVAAMLPGFAYVAFACGLGAAITMVLSDRTIASASAQYLTAPATKALR